MANVLSGFQTINLLKGTVTMAISANGISVSKSAVHILKYAEHAQFMINYNTKQVAIKGCGQGDEGALPFYKSSRKSIEAKWNLTELKNEVSSLMNWDLNKHAYRADGKFYRTEETLIFSLEDAKALR